MAIRVVEYEPRFLDAWNRMREALFAGEDPTLLAVEAEQLATSGRLRDQPFQCLIALDGDRAIGFLELSLRSSAEDCMTSPVAYVEGWYVDENHRTSGAGRALMEAAFVHARSAWNAREIASDTRPENTQSADAHAALGFEDTGIIRCFRREL